jgi:hypothetical protein
MKKHLFMIIAAFCLMFTACNDPEVAPVLQDAAGQKAGQKVLNLRAHLSSDQEVPVNDSRATGQAIFQLRNGGAELHYKLIVANIENVVMAHIHVAPAGVNGPVVLWLYPEGPPPQLIPGRFNGVLAQGTVTSNDLVGPLAGMELSDLAALMLAGETYVNVHTQQYPGGEIRGQISGTLPGGAW